MTEELVNVPNLPTPYYSQAKKAIAEARTTDDLKEVRLGWCRGGVGAAGAERAAGVLHLHGRRI
jgi:hypothetical protein